MPGLSWIYTTNIIIVGSNIYKRKDGRFEGRVPVGYQENGKIKYKSVYAKTLSEVKEKMSEVYSIRQNQPGSAIKLQYVRQHSNGYLLQNSGLRNQAMQIMKTLLTSIFCRF